MDVYFEISDKILSTHELPYIWGRGLKASTEKIKFPLKMKMILLFKIIACGICVLKCLCVVAILDGLEGEARI